MEKESLSVKTIAYKKDTGLMTIKIVKEPWYMEMAVSMKSTGRKRAKWSR